jgi:hypothetical protein
MAEAHVNPHDASRRAGAMPEVDLSEAALTAGALTALAAPEQRLAQSRS